MKDRWVALLKGINVGGHNKLPMVDLRQIAGSLGWGQLSTYIASGNLVFSASGTAGQLAQDLQSELLTTLKIKVPVIVLPADSFTTALTKCPFAPDDPRQVHALFLMGHADLNQDLLDQFATASEAVTPVGNIVWLHTPDGYGRSALAGKMNKILNVDYTARNLRTVQRIATMLLD